MRHPEGNTDPARAKPDPWHWQDGGDPPARDASAPELEDASQTPPPEPQHGPGTGSQDFTDDLPEQDVLDAIGDPQPPVDPAEKGTGEHGYEWDLYDPKGEIDEAAAVAEVLARIQAGDPSLNGEVPEAVELSKTLEAYLRAMGRQPEAITEQAERLAALRLAPLREIKRPPPDLIADEVLKMRREIVEAQTPLDAGNLDDRGMAKLSPWIIRREGAPGLLLAEGTEMVLTGAGGSGKTTLALQIALTALAGGGPCCGLEVRGGPALIVSYEDEAGWIVSGLAKRLDPGKSWRGLGVLGRDRISTHGPLMGPPPDARWADIARAPACDLLEKAVDRLGSGGILILDPASALISGVNDAHSVRRLYGELGAITRARGWGVIVVAHPNKAGRLPEAATADKVSGSTAWTDTARAVLLLEGMKLTAIKCNRSPNGWQVPLLRMDPIGWAPAAEPSEGERDAMAEAQAMAGAGMSQQEIADEMGVHRSRVRRWLGRLK